jgi:hypothetical protein
MRPVNYKPDTFHKTTMKKPISTLTVIAIALFLTSCAATYKRIDPPQVRYPVIDEEGTFSYQYDVIRTAGNKKLAKKELKAYMHVVAVKIHNNTDHSLEYGRNYKIFSGNSEANLLGPQVTGDIVKQKAAFHLFYLLLTPMMLNIDGGSSASGGSSIPIGLVIGPGLAFGNLAVAATANKRFREELVEYDLENKVIAPGETVYGLITIRDNGHLPLSLRFKQ